MLGRFLSADTIVPKPGYPQSFNRYAYTYNNPLRYIDPTGHLTIPQIEEFTTYKTDEMLNKLDPDLLKMLLALHFGDLLYFNAGSFGVNMGQAWLDSTNHHLDIGGRSLADLVTWFGDMKKSPSLGSNYGWIVERMMGKKERGLAYWSGGRWSQDYQNGVFPGEKFIEPPSETDLTAGSGESSAAPTILGAPISMGVGAFAAGFCEGITLGACTPVSPIVGGIFAIGTELVVNAIWPVKDQDRTLTYEYPSGAKESVFIRGGQIIEHKWENTGADYDFTYRR